VDSVVDTLTGQGFDPENVMISLRETCREDRSFAGGWSIYT
jgi:hypothetical protein